MKSDYQIRPYQEQDFPAIQRLNAAEGWNQLVRLHDRTKLAWQHSNAASCRRTCGERRRVCPRNDRHPSHVIHLRITD